MRETAGNEPVSTHDEGQECACVMHHTPKVTHVHRHHILPLSWDGPDTPDNIVWLCPSSHEHVHILLRAYVKYEGAVPWSIRRQFNAYVNALAAEGWGRR